MTKLTKLNNGMTVISDSIDNIETISLGIFVNVGSVNETDNQKGLSHFLEHMVFKGTTTRSALQISNEIESVGGIMNAFTGQEMTGYHVKILKEHLPLAIDIISDMLQNPTFDQVEFDRERKVVIQEIKMCIDSPDDYISGLFQSTCFTNERLGSPILGFEDGILSYTPDDIRNYMDSNYSIDKMVLVASGNINHDNLVELASNFIVKLKQFHTNLVEKQKYTGGYVFKEKDLEQTHVMMGYEGYSYTDKNKYKLKLLSAILGSGCSSRLFNEVREKRGLVYTVYSTTDSFRDTGTFGVYAACEPEKTEEVISIVKRELTKIQSNLSTEELNKAKMQLKSSILMGLENNSNRMERIASQYLLEGKLTEIGETIDNIMCLNVDDIQEVAKNIVNNTHYTLTVLGKPSNTNFYEI
ncbi:MAG: insulinase family protein [Alphaproteobacteria bacterium]|nr:insulinase family protein [Alphaproteobacteria bacterium]